MASCCSACFRDPILQSFLEEKGGHGACDFCGTSSAKVLSPARLSEHFETLLLLYETVPAAQNPFDLEKPTDPWDIEPPLEMLEHTKPADIKSWSSSLRSGRDLRLYPPRNTIHWWDTEPSKPLVSLLKENWQIFSHRIPDAKISELMGLILVEVGIGKDAIGDEWHWIAKKDIAEGKAYERDWGRFADHLRAERRFIPDVRRQSIVDMKSVIQGGLRLVERSVEEGEVAYRARLEYIRPNSQRFATPEPLPIEKMGAPPTEKTVDGGRLNPPGIAFLYLAFDKLTAIAEVRPPKGDLLSVATFAAKRRLRIANLAEIELLDSPFGHDDLVEEVEIRRLLDVLGHELAQPVDPQASSIEYVPTQFVAEVIRDAGFDGIIYPSALGPESNLVLFEPQSAAPTGCELMRVTDVEYVVESDSSGEVRALLEKVVNLVKGEQEEE